MSRFLKQLFDRTLNSVYFGILTMVLVAGYIAIGSGLPEVREYFDMNEMQFFNALPLKVLMTVLVLNLAIVTWTRIPLTPPRYGVWGVHAGIILLVMGMALHYAFKVEGQTLIMKGQTVQHFYDNTERSLYVKVSGLPPTGHELPSLPRFQTYPAGPGSERRFDAEDLRGIQPVITMRDRSSGAVQQRTVSDALGLAEPITIDVIGFHRYAHIVTDYLPDPSSKLSGLKLHLTDPHGGAVTQEWLVSEGAGASGTFGGAEIEHRHLPDAASADALGAAAGRVHALTVRAGGRSQQLAVEVGKSYEIKGTGYTLVIERFDPAWPMFGTNEIVQALTMRVIARAPAPQREFRRMVLAGKTLQTDFALDVPDAGPMGKRQTQPLDADLQVDYALNDSLRLLPRMASQKHLLVSTDEGDDLLHVRTALDGPTLVETIQSGASIELPHDEHGHGTAVKVERVQNVLRDDRVVDVPEETRRQQEDSMGIRQVLVVRVRHGNWSQEVAVPYSQYAADVPWTTPSVTIPGTNATLALQLGNTNYQLPARLTLDDFELVTYAGGDVNSGVFRDFKSTLTIEDPRTGESFTGVAHMNSPIYFDSGRWLFFQSAWDSEGQRWSVIGVGNRPHVWTMTAGCVLIFVGLIYAFYVKPIIIRRMKQKALEKAQASGKLKGRAPAAEELVAS